VVGSLASRLLGTPAVSPILLHCYLQYWLKVTAAVAHGQARGQALAAFVYLFFCVYCVVVSR